MRLTAATLNSLCASSTVTLRMRSKHRRSTRGNHAFRASRRVQPSQRRLEANWTCQSQARRRQRRSSKAAARRTTRLTRRRRSQTVPRIIVKCRSSRIRLLRRQARQRVCPARLSRRSQSCVCCYDQSSTVRIMSRINRHSWYSLWLESIHSNVCIRRMRIQIIWNGQRD